MSEKVMAPERRVGVPHLSLRSPMSYPSWNRAADAGSEGDSPNLTGRDSQEIKVQNGGSSPKVSSCEKSIQEKNQLITLDNVLCVGNDPAIFDMVKPLTRPASCHHCGLHGALRCSRCHQTYYCSVDCQTQDWKAHTIICKPAASKTANGDKALNRGESKAPAKLSSGALFPGTSNNVEIGRKITLADLEIETLSEGTEIQGYISEFSSPSNFFVQAYNAKSVEILMKLSILNKIYSKPENIKDYTPEIGEVCVARYAQDQQWYRVLVYSVEKTMKTAQVLYLDFGNKETVLLADLQPMHRDVDLDSPCAINCCIAHAVMPPCGWSPECLLDIKRLLMGQQHLFRIVRIDQEILPRYSVEISLAESGESVSKILQQKGYSFVSHSGKHIEVDSTEAVPTVEKTPKEKQSKPFSMPKSPETQGEADAPHAGNQFKVLITVFHNPEMMFCQKVEKAKQLAELFAAMNQRCSTLPITLGFLPQPGEFCCAQFTEDNNWYRASIVKHLSDDSVLVGYLDFGNTETLPISRLRPISADMLVTPFQATQCRLAGVKPPTGTWTSEAIQTIGHLLLNKVFTAAVVSESEGILTLDLIDESATPVIVSQHLVEAGLAKAEILGFNSASSLGNEEKDPSGQLKWAQLPLGEETEVAVCMLQNPGEFFCHISNPTDLTSLNELNTLLGQYCTQHVSDAYTPVKGEVCGTFFSGDGNWYRGQVKGFTTGGAIVMQFLDYGNTEEVTLNKLCKIPSSFLVLPFQAVSCSLAGVQPLGAKWELESVEKFQRALIGIKLHAKAVDNRDNGFSIELVACESGKAIADVLVAEGAALRDDSKMSNLGTSTKHFPAQRRTNEPSNPARSPAEMTTAKVMTDLSNSNPRSQKSLIERNPYSTSSSRANSAQSTYGEITSPTSSSLPPKESSASREDNSSNATLSTQIGNHSGYSTPPSQRDPPRTTLPAQRGLGSPNYVTQDPRGVGPVKSSPQLTSNPMPSPATYGSLKSEFNKPLAASPSPKKPLSTDSTEVSQRELHSSNSAPFRGLHYTKSSPPVQKIVPAGNPVQETIQPPVSSAEQQASPLSEELPSSTTNHPSSAVVGATKASVAQSWVSVDLPLNEPLPACVVKVKNPDLIYVFPKENRVDVERMQQVMMDIFSYCKAETAQPDYKPSVGDVCCAQFTADSQWYRAIILEISDSTAEIVFADYGNLETLPFSCLRPIKENFLHPPVQTTRCRLNGVAPVDCHWSSEVTQALDSLPLAGDVVITALSVEAGIYSVSVEKMLETGVIRVEEKLVMDGLAKGRHVIPLTAGCKENLSCCCQELKKRIEKLELLLEKLFQHES